MRSTILTALILAAAVSSALAQTPATEDHAAANAPLSAFADSIGDQPGAHICTHRASALMRAGRARLAGMTAAQASAAMPATDRDANTSDVVGIVYAAPQPTSIEDVQQMQFQQSAACAVKYGLTKLTIQSCAASGACGPHLITK